MLIATGSVRSLDVCVAVYVHDLEEDAQVDFKGKAKTFVQTYAFLSCVPPYTNAEWEKRSIFLNFLIMKLPAPDDENLSKGILDAIDVDSYGSRSGLCRRSCCPTRTPRSRPYRPAAAVTGRSPSRTASQNILKAFKDLFGDIAWQDRDRVGELITKTVPAQVAADSAFRNARQHSDEANARIEHDKCLGARRDAW